MSGRLCCQAVQLIELFLAQERASKHVELGFDLTGRALARDKNWRILISTAFKAFGMFD